MLIYMKVLIIRNAYEYDFGGGERFPLELAKILNKNGLEATVVSRSPQLLALATQYKVKNQKGLWWSRQDWSSNNILLLPLYILWQTVLTAWYLSLIIHHKFDIVHPQSKDDFIAATIAGKLLGKKIIWTDHADLKYIYQNHSLWYKNPIGKVVFWLSKLAYAITLVSYSEELLIKQQLGNLPHNYQVIHNGVPSPNIKPTSRPKDDKNSIIFVALSRLVDTKGVAELIDAFSRLNKPNAKLWLLGEGPDKNKFIKMAENNKNIVFFGFPDNALPLAAAGDIFVHPSYHEGFSLALIEACKMGLPIIACDVGGNPEIIKDSHNGLLVPPKNSSALKAAMSKLYVDKTMRQKMGQLGRTIYLENFVLEDIIKKRFMPLYEK